MTRKVFWEDPYETELDTIISSVTDDLVIAEATIFYAFAGGQESDAGTIADLPVLEARKDGLEIFYTLPAGHGGTHGFGCFLSGPRSHHHLYHPPAGAGMFLPGFMVRVGSNTRRTDRMRSSNSGEYCTFISASFSIPIPCSPEMEPPKATAARATASIIRARRSRWA